MNNTALIFGVTGQDGSYLSEYLLDLGYKVVGVTRRCSVNNTVNLKKHVLPNPNFLLLEGDVSDYMSVSGAFNKATKFCNSTPKEVYNLAAQSHVGLSFEQPLSTFKDDAIGPINILNVIYREGYTGSRFYQASTSEMFGSNFSVTTDGCYQNEDTPLSPNSPYAVAKVAAHHMVKLFREAYGVYACAGILFNHESPRRGEKFVTRKISKYVAQLHNALSLDQTIPKLELGNLEAYRDWGYAPDYVRAMHMMLNRDKPEDFVIGTGETHTVKEFCQLAFGLIGINNWENYVNVSTDFVRPLDVQYLKADPRKANFVLGWSPQVTFTDLVKIMVRNDVDAIYNN